MSLNSNCLWQPSIHELYPQILHKLLALQILHGSINMRPRLIDTCQRRKWNWDVHRVFRIQHGKMSMCGYPDLLISRLTHSIKSGSHRLNIILRLSSSQHHSLQHLRRWRRVCEIELLLDCRLSWWVPWSLVARPQILPPSMNLVLASRWGSLGRRRGICRGQKCLRFGEVECWSRRMSPMRRIAFVASGCPAISKMT